MSVPQVHTLPSPPITNFSPGQSENPASISLVCISGFSLCLLVSILTQNSLSSQGHGGEGYEEGTHYLSSLP